jgi:hypothetical protein
MLLTVETRSQTTHVRQYGLGEIALPASAVAELVATDFDYRCIGVNSKE